MEKNAEKSTSEAANPQSSVTTEVKAHVETNFDATLSTLEGLVSIPSVAWESHDLSRVRESAERVAELARNGGFDDVEILTAPKPESGEGMPAVVARKHPKP